MLVDLLIVIACLFFLSRLLRRMGKAREENDRMYEMKYYDNFLDGVVSANWDELARWVEEPQIVPGEKVKVTHRQNHLSRVITEKDKIIWVPTEFIEPCKN